MERKIVCPFCDSEDVGKINIEESFHIPFCEDATIPHENFRCNNCEEEGDFDNTLDRSLTKAINEANAASAPKIIESLVKDGITMTYLEKSLRLPFRTTARWKRGRISCSSLALLRLVRFSPALLQVAVDNFSETAQAKYHITQPYYFFDRHTTNRTYSLVLNNESIELAYQGEIPNLHLQSISPSEQHLKWEPVL